MKRVKRFFTVFLCSVYIVSSVSSSYVTARAAAIPIVYSSWEVIEMIFLSLGITFELSETSLGQEFVGELEDCFELYMHSNGFDNPEQTIRDFQMCIEEGKNGIITLSNNVWNALKDWAGSLWAYSGSDGVLTSSEVVEMLDNCASGVDTTKFKNYIQQCMNMGYTYIVVDSPSRSQYICIYVIDSTATGEWKSNVGDYYRCEYKAGKWTNIVMAGFLSYKGAFSQYYSQSNVFCYEGDSVIVRNSLLGNSSDVIFPENSGAYDVCRLQGYDLADTFASGGYDVITSGRTWDGTDVAGDVVITMPTDVASDLPFQGVYDGVVAGDIPFADVLEDAGVIPVDTTLDRDLVDGNTISGAIVDNVIDQSPSIDDTKEDVDEDGNVIESNVPMTFDLSKLFPFCIPFDIIDFLGLLSAPPVAPHIQYPIQYPTFNGTETYMLDIDLAQFDDIAALLRKMETLLFIVGLAGITRNHMIRG